MRVRNDTGQAGTWVGQLIAPNQEFDIPVQDLHLWRANDKVVSDVTALTLAIGDGVTYKTTSAEAIGFLLGTLPADVKVQESPAFSSKTVGPYSLFMRAHGQACPMIVGQNTCNFSVPYPQCKFNAIELIGAEFGDKVSLQVLDTPVGTVSSIPNFLLNQFGFDVYVPTNFYARASQYDADLIQDMNIRVLYDSVSAKTVYINYILHELKL